MENRIATGKQRRFSVEFPGWCVLGDARVWMLVRLRIPREKKEARKSTVSWHSRERRVRVLPREWEVFSCEIFVNIPLCGVRGIGKELEGLLHTAHGTSQGWKE